MYENKTKPLPPLPLYKCANCGEEKTASEMVCIVKGQPLQMVLQGKPGFLCLKCAGGK